MKMNVPSRVRSIVLWTLDTCMFVLYNCRENLFRINGRRTAYYTGMYVHEHVRIFYKFQNSVFKDARHTIVYTL